MKKLVLLLLTVFCFSAFSYSQKVDISYRYHLGASEYENGSELGIMYIFGQRGDEKHHLGIGVSAFTINKEVWDYHYSDKTLSKTGISLGWYPQKNNDYF